MSVRAIALALLVVLTGAVAAHAATPVSGTISTNTTWTVAGSPYVLNGRVTVAAGVTLTVEPGAVIKTGYYQWGLWVDGTLVADGTPGAPIVFTSYQDDTVGGDTNGDGSASTPARGDWGAIVFTGSSVGSILDEVVVRYAGAAYSGAVLVDYTSGVTLSNSTISDSLNSGVYVAGAAPVITGNVIERNASYGIYLSSATTPQITNNTIRNNGSYGAYNATTTVLNAENSFWGAASGPLDSSDDRATGGLYNPTGDGNRVSDYVDYAPWLTSDPNAHATSPFAGYVYDVNTTAPFGRGDGAPRTLLGSNEQFGVGMGVMTSFD